MDEIIEIPLSKIKKQTLSPVLNRKRFLILGAKNTGKSTTVMQLCRILMMNDDIYILDCDIGQPLSWGTPGFITLYQVSKGSNVNNVKQIYNGFVGEFSSHSCIEIYFTQIRKALEYVQDSNLIINTQGYVQSFGSAIAQHLVTLSRPDVVLFLSNSSNTKEKVDELEKRLYDKTFNLNDNLYKQEFIGEKPELIHIQDDYMKNMNGDAVQNTLALQNPQSKKQRRERLLLRGLGIQLKNQQTPVINELSALQTQKFKISETNFVSLPYTLDISQKPTLNIYTNQDQIAQIFNFSLVAIQQWSPINSQESICQNSIGIAMIKDFQLKDGTFELICKEKICNPITLVKSQFFELGRETIDFKIEDILEIQDMNYLLSGKKLPPKYQVPYINPRSNAVGFVSLKLKINKKKQKNI